MNKSSTLIAIAALTLLASTAARAGGEVDYASQFAQQFGESQRTRAEVMAEAANVAKNRSLESYGSRVTVFGPSATERADVRADAAQALRQGQILEGEISL